MICLKRMTFCALRHAYNTRYRRCHNATHAAAADSPATSATPLVDAINANQPGCLRPSDEATLRYDIPQRFQ